MTISLKKFFSYLWAMKRFLLFVFFSLILIPAFAQEQKPTADSSLSKMKEDISDIRTMLIDNGAGGAGRYKIYATTNIYTSLKLDTSTGKVTALQVTTTKGETMEYDITDAVVPSETMIGRFELYPTQNTYNFILLDTAVGYAYQVQWSTKREERGRWRIW